MDRRDKTNYYLDMAQVALERGTCLRRNFGAVIVKNDVIVSTGYNGAPRGRANCIDIGTCIRQKMGIPRGERYEFCRSVHAEMNAIIAAPRDQMIGATLYLVGRDMSTGKIMSDAKFVHTFCGKVGYTNIVDEGSRNPERHSLLIFLFLFYPLYFVK